MSVALHTFPAHQFDHPNIPSAAIGTPGMDTDGLNDEMMVDGDVNVNVDDEVQMLSGDEDIAIDEGQHEVHGDYAEDVDVDLDEGIADNDESTIHSNAADLDLEEDEHDGLEPDLSNTNKNNSTPSRAHEFSIKEDGENATSVVAQQEQSGLHQKNDVQIQPASSPREDTSIHTEASNHKNPHGDLEHSNSIDLSTEGSEGPKNVHVKTEQKDDSGDIEGKRAEINDIKACKDEDTGEVVIQTKQRTPDGEEDIERHVLKPGEDLDTEHSTKGKSGEVHSSKVHIRVDKANSSSESKHNGEDSKVDHGRNHSDSSEYVPEASDIDEQEDEADEYQDENEAENEGDDSRDDESYDDVENAPPTLLKFKNSSFVLFSKLDDREPLFSDSHQLFAEPLENFITAVKSEFVGLEIQDQETVLNFVSLQLTITEDNFYARQVALQDVYRLFVAALEEGSVEDEGFRIEMSLQPRFISRFNELATKIKEAEHNGIARQDEEESESYDVDADEEEEEHHDEDVDEAEEVDETIYEDAVEDTVEDASNNAIKDPVEGPVEIIPLSGARPGENLDESKTGIGASVMEGAGATVRGMNADDFKTQTDVIDLEKDTTQNQGKQMQDGIQDEEDDKEVTNGIGTDNPPIDLTGEEEYDYLAEADDVAVEDGDQSANQRAAGTVAGEGGIEDPSDILDDDGPSVRLSKGTKRGNGSVDTLEAELEEYDSPAPEPQSKRIKSD